MIDTFLIRLGVKSEIASRTERGIERFALRQPLRSIVRYGVGEYVTNTFADMIHPTEHTAFSEVGRIGADLGVNIGLRSLFMGSLTGGAIIGGLVTILNAYKDLYRQIEERNRKNDELSEKFENEIREKSQKLGQLLAEADVLTEETLTEIREKIFAKEIG